MTVAELIAALSALPPQAQYLPVTFQAFDVNEDGDDISTTYNVSYVNPEPDANPRAIVLSGY